MPSRQQIEWLIFAVLAATSAIFIAPPDTPIDRALPFVIVLLSFCGFVAVEDSRPRLSGQRGAAVLHLAIV
ncbi:MAG TPA: hypothetical protein VGA33_11480, partial [Thermoanaerobaculia bacterium]